MPPGVPPVPSRVMTPPSPSVAQATRILAVQRWRIAATLTVLMVCVYFGFIALVAYDATLLATPLYAERLALPHATSFAELRDVLLDLQAVTVCTQCAVRRGLTDSDLLPGAHIAGAASFVEAARTLAAVGAPPLDIRS